MWSKTLIPLLLIFILASSMSETVLFVFEKNKKDMVGANYKKENEEEKNEEKSEKELDELLSYGSNEAFLFNQDEYAAMEKASWYLHSRYKEPHVIITTPPPKV